MHLIGQSGTLDRAVDERCIGWSTHPGRLLSFGPAWADSGGHLVFDEASGDYWVLNPLALRIVRALHGGALAKRSELTRLVQIGGDGSVDAPDLSGTLAELVEARLLQAVAEGARP